jgi:AcrR family transcriptional regulator
MNKSRKEIAASSKSSALRQPRLRKSNERRTDRTRSTRRIGSENSKTRSDLLNAAEKLMRTEGYASVTSRKVAKQAKLTPQLVHYYFHTMDDLFLALWRRFVNNNLERQIQAAQSPEPLRALWEFSKKTADTSLETEFLALAHHRKSIRDELTRDANNFRRLQFTLLSSKLASYGFDDDGWSGEIGVVLLTSLARSLIMEGDLGVSEGHREALEYVERWIDRLESRARN